MWYLLMHGHEYYKLEIRMFELVGRKSSASVVNKVNTIVTVQM